MGDVYLARDSRLDREVAIKFLADHGQADNEEARSAITREAKAASRLNHPNVAHVYELGYFEGRLYIAMEYVDGGSLASRLASNSPPEMRTIIDIAVQIADALDAAHSKGIVHRDLKPGNVMMTERGEPKLVDFGLSKLTSTDEATVTVSTPGQIRGTIPYMSPEQVLGGTVDHRSDIFSFGTLLYEMAARRRPFDGAAPTETIGRILHTQPEPVSRHNYDAPPELDRIVRKCLAKKPDDRYQATRELVIDLRSLQRDMQSDSAPSTLPTPPDVTPIRSRTSTSPQIRIAARAIALLVLAAAVATTWWYVRTPPPASIAVLPFVNETGTEELDYVVDGLTESVINSLSRVGSLRVFSRAAVYRFRGRERDAQAVAAKLNATAVVVGRVSRRQDDLIVRTELIDVKSNQQLWGRQFTTRVEGLPSVQDEIAQETAENLHLRLSGEERRQMTRRFTGNAQAYQLYLKGRYHWNKRTRQGFETSIDLFQQAIALDHDYALAYAGLADTYAQLSGIQPPREIMPKAKAAAIRALEIDETLAEAHASLAFVKFHYDWDWLETERECKRALQLNPNYATAHSIYSRFLNAVGRFDEATDQIRQAQELDPLALGIGTGYGLTYYFNRRFDDAITQYRKTLELDPTFYVARGNLASALLQKRDYAAAVAEYEKVHEQMSSDVSIACELGQLYAVMGRKQDALAMVDKVMAVSKTRYINAPPVAWIYSGLGDRDKAFEWLEKGYAERAWPMVFLKVEPKYDALRGDARFASLLQRVGF
jgi:serine/threonine-protein kinase